MRFPYIFFSMSGEGPGKPGKITSRSLKRIIRYSMPVVRHDNSRVRIHSNPIGSRSMPAKERMTQEFKLLATDVMHRAESSQEPAGGGATLAPGCCDPSVRHLVII